MSWLSRAARNLKRELNRAITQVQRTWRKVAPAPLYKVLKRAHKNVKRTAGDIALRLDAIAPVFCIFPAAVPLALANLGAAAAAGKAVGAVAGTTAGGAASTAASGVVTVGPHQISTAPIFPIMRRPRAALSEEGIAQQLVDLAQNAKMAAVVISSAITGQYYAAGLAIAQRMLEIEMAIYHDKKLKQAIRKGAIRAAAAERAAIVAAEERQAAEEQAAAELAAAPWWKRLAALLMADLNRLGAWLRA